MKLQKIARIAFAACAALVRAQEPGVVKSEFIFETAPFPSCHASTIVEEPGALVCAWFGGTAERNPDVGIWLSRHAAGKWTPPVEVANGVQTPALRYPTWNPVLFQPMVGPLMLFYKVGPSPSEWWGMSMTSPDQGRTWSQPRRLHDGILGPIKNKPVQLSSGDILSPSSTEHDGWRVHFERSGDQGKSWTATPPQNDGREFAAIQPTILIHKDGRLEALGRTRKNGIFVLWSEDQGRTWSKMQSTGLPNPNSGIDATTLQDGRFLLVYNNSSTGRSPLNVAISSDGVTWRRVLTLEDTPGKQYAYPAVIQTSDGLVHITYTWKRERIKHVVIDPAKLP
jgi:predicted neuraminidase